MENPEKCQWNAIDRLKRPNRLKRTTFWSKPFFSGNCPIGSTKTVCSIYFPSGITGILVSMVNNQDLHNALLNTVLCCSGLHHALLNYIFLCYHSCQPVILLNIDCNALYFLMARYKRRSKEFWTIPNFNFFKKKIDICGILAYCRENTVNLRNLT